MQKAEIEKEFKEELAENMKIKELVEFPQILQEEQDDIPNIERWIDHE